MSGTDKRIPGTEAAERRSERIETKCLYTILAPPEVLDYVVIHELCHLKEMNHSKAFWDEVEKVMPEYETYKLWLKENGWRL